MYHSLSVQLLTHTKMQYYITRTLTENRITYIGLRPYLSSRDALQSS